MKQLNKVQPSSKCIIYTCAFPTVTRQNFIHENGLKYLEEKTGCSF